MDAFVKVIRGKLNGEYAQVIASIPTNLISNICEYQLLFVNLPEHATGWFMRSDFVLAEFPEKK